MCDEERFPVSHFVSHSTSGPRVKVLHTEALARDKTGYQPSMVQAGPASTATALALAAFGVLWQGLDYTTRPANPPAPVPPSLQEVVEALQKARPSRPSRRRRRSPQPQSAATTPPPASRGRKPKVDRLHRRRRTAEASSTRWWVAALLAGLASVAVFFGLRRASAPVNSGLADLAPGLGDNGAQSPPRPRPSRSARPSGHLGESSILDQLAAAEYRR